MTTRSHS